MTKLCVFAILSVIFYLSEKYEKLYCYPSQLKILELLKEYRGIKRCRRTLNRWMRYAEDNGFIKRIRRIKRDPVKGFMFKSTLYKITYKGYKLLLSYGVNCYEKIAEMAKKREKPKHNKEISKPQPPSQEKAISREAMRRIWDKAKARTSSVLTLFV